MAAKQTTDRDALVKALASEILAPTRSAPTRTGTVAEFAGNVAADSGLPFGEFLAGLGAAARNTKLAYSQGRERQAVRTAEHILSYRERHGL